MKIVKDTISIDELKQMAEKMFGNSVKAVVDIEQGVMAVDAALHAEQEDLLLDTGSKPEHLWSISIYPEYKGSDAFIVFDSVMNIRPASGNMSFSIKDLNIREKIKNIVCRLTVA